MKRVVMSVLLSALLATFSYAANVHLKGGSNAEPKFVDNGITLTASGAIAGLGNGDVLVTLDATGEVDATCGNPGSNQHQAPGQNPAPISVSGAEAIPAEEIKNGNVDFSVTTVSPENPIPGAPDCPNDSWVENIVDLSFFSATITVEQPEGTTVLVVECTIDPSSSDGAISGASVVCE